MVQGTNGFCTVDRHTGLILDACPSLVRFFGGQNLRGKLITDFLQPEHHRFMTNCLGSPHFRPMIVPVIRINPGSLLNCKVVPYYRTSRVVKISFQQIGEERSLFREATTNAALPNEIAQMKVQPSCFTHVTTTEVAVQTDSLSKPPKYPSSRLHALSRPSGESSASSSEQSSHSSESSDQQQWRQLLVERRINRKSRKTNRVPSMTIGSSYLPTISCFEVTPVSTVQALICQSLTRINPCGRGCCVWHVTLAQMHLALAELEADACRPQYSPHHDRQCKMCLALHCKEAFVDNCSARQQSSCDICPVAAKFAKLRL